MIQHQNHHHRQQVMALGKHRVVVTVEVQRLIGHVRKTTVVDRRVQIVKIVVIQGGIEVIVVVEVIETVCGVRDLEGRVTVQGNVRDRGPAGAAGVARGSGGTGGRRRGLGRETGGGARVAVTDTEGAAHMAVRDRADDVSVQHKKGCVFLQFFFK